MNIDLLLRTVLQSKKNEVSILFENTLIEFINLNSIDTEIYFKCNNKELEFTTRLGTITYEQYDYYEIGCLGLNSNIYKQCKTSENFINQLIEIINYE